METSPDNKNTHYSSRDKMYSTPQFFFENMGSHSFTTHNLPIHVPLEQNNVPVKEYCKDNDSDCYEVPYETQRKRQESCGSPESGIESDHPISPPSDLWNSVLKIKTNDNNLQKSIINLPQSHSCNSESGDSVKINSSKPKYVDKTENVDVLNKCKRLHVRRIKNLNGKLKRVLILETDFSKVANQYFLKERDRMHIPQVVFDQPRKLPHKKRYFFSLSSLNAITKLKRKELSSFECVFDDSDDDERTSLNTNHKQSAAKQVNQKNRHLLSHQADINIKYNYSEFCEDDQPSCSYKPCSKKSKHNNLSQPKNDGIGNHDKLESTNTINSETDERDWVWQGDVDSDTFYASDWDPTITNPDSPNDTSEQNENSTEMFVDSSSRPTSPVTSSVMGRLDQLKMALKKREKELENVRRRRGFIE